VNNFFRSVLVVIIFIGMIVILGCGLFMILDYFRFPPNLATKTFSNSFESKVLRQNFIEKAGKIPGEIYLRELDVEGKIVKSCFFYHYPNYYALRFECGSSDVHISNPHNRGLIARLDLDVVTNGVEITDQESLVSAVKFGLSVLDKICQEYNLKLDGTIQRAKQDFDFDNAETEK
jgi:hypothetical protein